MSRGQGLMKEAGVESSFLCMPPPTGPLRLPSRSPPRCIRILLSSDAMQTTFDKAALMQFLVPLAAHVKIEVAGLGTSTCLE